jgi:hypothetical protein
VRCCATRAPYLETAKVFKVVLGLPGYGSVKATEILHRCRVSPSKTFGGLSERQRYELAERLDRSPSRAFQEASDTSPSADTSSACALAIAHDFSYLAPPGRTTHARHVPRWTCRRGTGRS